MKNRDYGSDLFLIFCLLIAILASVNHVEKAINRQSDLLAHAIVRRSL